jgi:tetratricopeptide (TPR) repeat protein
VVGFSWGGIANVFAAARDNRITALVCLDGSIRYWPKLIAEAKVVTPERITVPMLFAGEPTASIENLLREGDDLSGSFLNQLVYSDFYFMNMAPMVHQDFNSESLRFKRDSAYQEFSREEASLAHSWVARYVRHFLDAYLKKADSSVAFLNAKPVANGAPQHLFTVEARPASTTPSTLLSLAEHLSKVGYDKALEVYRSMQKRKPGFQLSERDMNRWAYQMLGAGKVKAAIEIFKLEGLSYPDSWNAFDSLAEGYEADKDTAEAIRHYQRSLELNPKNDHAVEQLKTLRAVPGAAALKNP